MLKWDSQAKDLTTTGRRTSCHERIAVQFLSQWEQPDTIHLHAITRYFHEPPILRSCVIICYLEPKMHSLIHEEAHASFITFLALAFDTVFLALPALWGTRTIHSCISSSQFCGSLDRDLPPATLGLTTGICVILKRRWEILLRQLLVWLCQLQEELLIGVDLSCYYLSLPFFGLDAGVAACLASKPFLPLFGFLAVGLESNSAPALPSLTHVSLPWFSCSRRSNQSSWPSSSILQIGVPGHFCRPLLDSQL